MIPVQTEGGLFRTYSMRSAVVPHNEHVSVNIFTCALAILNNIIIEGSSSNRRRSTQGL